jgi:hypothetical protein
VSDSPRSAISIHVSRIDEFLASRFLDAGGVPLAFSVRDEGGNGNIMLTPIEAPSGQSDGEGVDFELSACECGELGADDAGVYLGRPVYTSSAYELFDFILGYLSSFDCYIEFTGNAWRIRVENAVSG